MFAMSSSTIHNEGVPKNKKKLFINDTIKTLLIALIVVIPIRVFIAQPFIVSGSSMDPTFTSSDYLIVDQLSYRLNEPKRLDVVIFRYPKDPKRFFIKRIIGLPGESVTVEGGLVMIDSPEIGQFELEEPYVEKTKIDSSHLELGEGEYFVMGDNRASSLDSRIWGALDKDLILGKAYLRLFPISNIGLNPGSVFSVE